MMLFYMMVGLPGVGKSTYISEILASHPKETFVILSTDDLIEQFAREAGQTYGEAVRTYFNKAESLMQKNLVKAIADKNSIIWDQTNTTKKSRAKKLVKIPKGYKKVALYIPAPDKDEHDRRLNRPEKMIPKFIVESLKKGLVIPTVEEGFDQVILI